MERRKVLRLVGLGLFALWVVPRTVKKVATRKCVRLADARVGDRVRICHAIGPDLEDLANPREEWGTVTTCSRGEHHSRVTVVTDSGLDFTWRTRHAA